MAAPPRVDVYTPVMGTVLEVVVQPAELADAVGGVVLGEIARLTAVLSGHDPDSELSRWRRGEHPMPGADLAAVLHAAAEVHAASRGAFHPAVGSLGAAWAEAVTHDRMPDPAAMRDLARSVRDLPYRTRMTPGPTGPRIAVERLDDCARVDLDALAKGYVVDAAIRAALGAFPGRDDVGVTVNAGGDLRHGGAGRREVQIEDPLRPYDNAPPLTSVTVRRAALATSGTARRGYTVAGRRLGHVLDPRTGWPTGGIASASVLAADTMTADGVATAAMVLGVEEALALAEARGLAVLLVGRDGAVRTSTGWSPSVPRAGGRPRAAGADRFTR